MRLQCQTCTLALEAVERTFQDIRGSSMLYIRWHCNGVCNWWWFSPDVACSLWRDTSKWGWCLLQSIKAMGTCWSTASYHKYEHSFVWQYIGWNVANVLLSTGAGKFPLVLQQTPGSGNIVSTIEELKTAVFNNLHLYKLSQFKVALWKSDSCPKKWLSHMITSNCWMTFQVMKLFTNQLTLFQTNMLLLHTPQNSLTPWNPLECISYP